MKGLKVQQKKEKHTPGLKDMLRLKTPTATATPAVVMAVAAAARCW